jgi:hypothetical protein
MLWRKGAGALLVAGFCLFGIMTLVGRSAAVPARPVPAALKEQWRPELARVRSVGEAMDLLPAYMARERGSREARAAKAINQFVQERFFHGESELTYRQNWLGRLAGAGWLNLRVPVIPDDILKHRRAICSQQAIVFMELLRRQGLHYASVLISWPAASSGSIGHFAVAARVDGRWLYFDPDQEVRQAGVPMARVMDGSALPMLYGDKPALLEGLRQAAALGRIRLAYVDAFPAPRGGLFQSATKWLSAWGWLFFGLLALPFVLPERRRPFRLLPAG